MQRLKISFLPRIITLSIAIALFLPIAVQKGISLWTKIEVMAQQETEEVKQHSDKLRFYVSLVAALGAIGVGVVINVHPLGASWIVGGCLTMMWAYLVSWRWLNEMQIFVSLLFVILFLFGVLWFFWRRRKD